MSPGADRQTILRILSKNLPSPNDRRVVLEVFAAGIEQGSTHGDDRWVVKAKTGDRPLIRLHVGPVIIQSLVPNGIWLSLDHESLKELPDSSPVYTHLSWNSNGMFEEYGKYPSIGSKNAYIYPGGTRWADFERDVWPDLSKVHFESIDRAAVKNRNGVGQRTGRGHQPEILETVEDELQRSLPRPKDWTL